MLISLHLPKTAGESFYKTLNDFYGSDILKDYKDYPVNTEIHTRNTCAIEQYTLISNKPVTQKCIHGHFLPIKYLSLLSNENTFFITWLRNPVERIISHYYYWMERSTIKNHAPLHKKIVQEKWSLEAFCLSSELQNIYEQFLWGFPLRYFDFIGITEHYQTDLLYFSEKYLDGSSKEYKQNTRSVINNNYDICPALRLEIEKFHSKDMALYQRACNIRKLRTS